LNLKPTSEHELARLKDEELIAYAVGARDAGQRDAFETAAKLFAGRRMGLVSYWVSQKTDPEEVDEITGKALVSIINGITGVTGSSPGEFVEWMRTVTRRRIADHYRAKEKLPGFTPLDDQPKDEGQWTEKAGEPDSTGGVDTALVVDAALNRLNEVKREVVEKRIEGYSAKETAEMSRDPDMTPVNVDQIFSRFKKALKKELNI
jgi:RNA polymerase sigma factor (sigma-70 family)